jgi:ribosomal-protein-alanine N-acetyltransferase
LRDYREQDYETVFYLRSDDGMNEFIKRERPEHVDEAVKFIRKVQSGMENGINVNWVISTKEDQKMIGSICLWNFSDDLQTAEIGYDLHPAFQKKGYMHEAVQIVLRFGFKSLQFHNIQAYTHKLNKRSIGLLMKNGFRVCEGKTDAEDENNIILSLNRKTYFFGPNPG